MMYQVSRIANQYLFSETSGGERAWSSMVIGGASRGQARFPRWGNKRVEGRDIGKLPNCRFKSKH